MKDQATFLKSFLRNPAAVGAITPSGARLVAAMVDWFDWGTVRNVVEFGPGTGVFTEAILRHLHHEAKFFAIERSPQMAAATRKRCPDATVYEESATNLLDLCQRESILELDAIISGLPWSTFPKTLQIDILDAAHELIKPGGRFATFAYWQGMLLPGAKDFARLLDDRFSSVRRSRTIWGNVPPAFVYQCVR